LTFKQFRVLCKLHKARKRNKPIEATSIDNDNLPGSLVMELIRNDYAYTIDIPEETETAIYHVDHVVITEKGITAKSAAFWSVFWRIVTAVIAILGILTTWLKK
jgi:hypothetical protein